MASGSVEQSAASDYMTVNEWLDSDESGSGSGVSIAYAGKTVNLIFLTIPRVHEEGRAIMQVPSEWLPSKNIDFMAWVGGYPILLRLYGITAGSNAGKMVVWLPSQTTVGARIYGYLSYIRK